MVKIFFFLHVYFFKIGRRINQQEVRYFSIKYQELLMMFVNVNRGERGLSRYTKSCEKVRWDLIRGHKVFTSSFEFV